LSSARPARTKGFDRLIAQLLVAAGIDSGSSRHADYHLGAAVKLHISFRAKQNAGGLSHARVLLSRFVDREQDAGN